jgi:hypothetical protein
LACAHVPQFPAERLLGDLEAKLLEQPPREIDQPPANDAMDGGEGAVLPHLPQHLALAVVENAGGARRLAVQALNKLDAPAFGELRRALMRSR